MQREIGVQAAQLDGGGVMRTGARRWDGAGAVTGCGGVESDADGGR